MPGQGDDDEDGLANPDDNCPFNSNAGQADGDKDGTGDICEPFMYGNDFEGSP